MATDIATLLEKIGYSYFKVDEAIPINDLIIKIIVGQEPRFVKAIPFILYLSNKKDTLLCDIPQLLKQAKENHVLPEVKALLYVTLKLFKIVDKGHPLVYVLEKQFIKEEVCLLEALFHSEDYQQFNTKTTVSDESVSRYKKKVVRIYFRFDEFLYEFTSQKTLFEAKERITLAERLNISKEQDLQYALHILFKPKQLEIITKIANDKKLTKVEYDYYFKTIKKRLRAVKLLDEFADSIIQRKVSKQ